MCALLSGSSCAPSTETPKSAGTLADSFNTERAWKDLEHLVAMGPRQAGTAGAEKARVFMEAQLTAAGLKPVREAFQQQTPAGPLDFANVYADLAPRDKAATAPWILFCAHYDTKRLPGTFVGANDGGSGTAVLLELARALAAAGPREFGYRFLFLDGEESVNLEWVDPDNRYGSRHHAAKLKNSGQAAKFRACVLLDMVGDKNLNIEQEGFSDPRLHAVFAEAARELKLDQYVSAKRGAEIIDDHLIFMAAGIRSVDLIDFDYGPGNSYWHTLNDKLEHCSAQSLGIVGRVVLAAVPSLEARLALR